MHSTVSFPIFGYLTWQMVLMWGIGALLTLPAQSLRRWIRACFLPWVWSSSGRTCAHFPSYSVQSHKGHTDRPHLDLFEHREGPNELFPLLLFIGHWCHCIDFGPLLEKPWLMLFGEAAQFGFFLHAVLAGFFFDLRMLLSRYAVIRCSRWSQMPSLWPTRLAPLFLGAIMVVSLQTIWSMVHPLCSAPR